MSEYSELKRLAKEYISLMNNDDDDMQICMEAKHEYELASDAEVILALIAENEALHEEIATDDKIIAERDRLLSMFECPEHGQCVPYAMEQVEALRKDADRLDWLTAQGEIEQPGQGDVRGFIDAAMAEERKD